jgi:hypothetical protein
VLRIRIRILLLAFLLQDGTLGRYPTWSSQEFEAMYGCRIV